MKRKLLNVLVAGMVALPLGFTLAEDEPKDGGGKGKGRPGQGKGGPPERRGFQPPNFAEIDADKSGDISKEEWVAFQVKAAEERAERSFQFIAGDDGKITEEELKGLADRRRGGFGRPPGGGPGRGPKGGEGKGGDAKGGGGKKPERPPLEE